MALLTCPECGNIVSEHAIKCPNCACPIDHIMVSTPQKSIKDQVKDQVHDPNKCWFCQEREATHLFEHTFSVESEELNFPLKKTRTIKKKVKVPCCDKCEKAIDSKSIYALAFAIVGTLSVVVPVDYKLYTIDPAALIPAIAFELFIGLILLAWFFGWFGTVIWECTHKDLSKQLKRDISEHQVLKDLEEYDRTHPLESPTLSEFIGLKK